MWIKWSQHALTNCIQISTVAIFYCGLNGPDFACLYSLLYSLSNKQVFVQPIPGTNGFCVQYLHVVMLYFWCDEV